MATAADIMTKTVVTVTPETRVSEAAELLAGQRFGAAPVLNDDGHVLGIVTEEDLVQRAASLHLPRHLDFLGGIIYLEDPRRFQAEAEKILAVTVEQIMDRAVPRIAPDTPVAEVATRLLDDDLRRLLVMDDRGCLLGIITRADIVRLQVKEHRLTEG